MKCHSSSKHLDAEVRRSTTENAIAVHLADVENRSLVEIGELGVCPPEPGLSDGPGLDTPPPPAGNPPGNQVRYIEPAAEGLTGPHVTFKRRWFEHGQPTELGALMAESRSLPT